MVVGVTALSVFWAGHARAAEPAVDVENLRPGLVATFRDTARPAPVEVVRLEPTVALALKAGEAPHPRLAADGGTARWEGYLNVLRPGPYRFSARLRGKLRVTVGGKEVLAAEEKADTPTLQKGPEVRLEAGVHPLVAEFTRLPGSARVLLMWQAPFFHPEPLPHDEVGHLPARAPARLAADRQLERGRFLAEENSCAGCHRPDGDDRLARGLAVRQGPDLSQVGQRVHAGWFYRWLEAPQKVRPGAAMPRMFSDDEAGAVERYAVSRYLAALGGPLRPSNRQANFQQYLASVARGKRLFTSTGCVTCHTLPQDNGSRQPSGKAEENGVMPPARRWELSGLGSKTTPEKLAAYLANPLAVDPSGRMPHMVLQGNESVDLARFLCRPETQEPLFPLPPEPGKEHRLAAFKRVENRADELKEFQNLRDEDQWKDLGKRLVIDKGCNNCHTIAPGGQPFATVLANAFWDDLKKPQTHRSGCLADDAGKRGKAPWFDFGEADRAALRALLRTGTAGAGSPAPAYAARLTLQRFNCLACHSRDGAGGLHPDLAEELRQVQKAENAEAVLPPPLTGVGHKLRTPWLRQVLTQAGRARPWMALRMPQFGNAHVGTLPEALAALDGTDPEDKVHQVPLTPAKIETGRRLVGKQALGCVSCHDIAGVVNTGTRGPDLALMNQRVRYDWYRRWLEQAQRIQPGTRMPSVFMGGKSLLDDVLGGNADAQAEAMWAYLSLGPTLPLPDGLAPPPGLVIEVKDRPVLLRTFMPDAGARAVAVGYPGGVSAAFDAVTCRLAYGWSGNFLDASPVWDNRGGSPARVMGARFWTAPPGCPWSVSESNEPPDFAAQSRDPAYGAAVPEGKLYDGPRQLRFVGYDTDKAGLPTFRYVLNAGQSEPVAVSERPEPLRSRGGVGLERQFTLSMPARRTAWLTAGETGQSPRLLDGHGNPQALELKSETMEVPAADRLLVLPQGGERAVVLGLAAAPPGTSWHLQRQNGTWKALLHLPATTAAAKVEVRLRVWAPYRDEPPLLKELVPVK
jgi:cbb3-type cytochrome oxidase cytochrome c subunit